MWSVGLAAAWWLRLTKPRLLHQPRCCTACENLCLNNMASMAYTRLVAALESHIKEEQQRVRERTTTDLDTFLGILNAYGALRETLAPAMVGKAHEEA